jgi:biotin operon repressor
LARSLLKLAGFGKHKHTIPIQLNGSQESLAEMIGTSRSRVNFFMNKFRRLGFIEYNGKIRGNKYKGKIKVNKSLSAVLYE